MDVPFSGHASRYMIRSGSVPQRLVPKTESMTPAYEYFTTYKYLYQDPGKGRVSGSCTGVPGHHRSVAEVYCSGSTLEAYESRHAGLSTSNGEDNVDTVYCFSIVNQNLHRLLCLARP